MSKVRSWMATAQAWLDRTVNPKRRFTTVTISGFYIYPVTDPEMLKLLGAALNSPPYDWQKEEEQADA